MLNQTDTIHLTLLQNLLDDAYQEGDLKQALVYAKHIVALHPIYEAYLQLVALCKEEGLYKPALTALHAAIALEPSNPEAHIEKALLLYELDQSQDAYDYLMSLRHILLDDTPWALFAVLSADLEHLDEALFYAAKAIAQNPSSWSYHARAIVYQARCKYPQAQEDFQKALQLDPYNPDLWNSYALFFEEIKAFEQALEVYNTAINNFDLTFPFLYLNRAKINHLLEHKSLAILDCELALAQMSDNGDVWFLLASLLHEEGNLLGALAAYNMSLRYIKKDASIHFCKAQVLEELGNIKQAKTSYEKAVRFAPTNRDITLAYNHFMLRYNLIMHGANAKNPYSRPNDHLLFP
jgi:tetratricopeptide (TPR) repeat protein